MLFGGKTQSTRRGEIEHARIAAYLPDHTGKITAFEPLFKREQRIFGGVRGDMDKPVLQIVW